MRVVSVVGNRPNIIKLAPIDKALEKHEHIIIHSGQHYDHDMSDIFFKDLNIPEPDYNLDVRSGTHGFQTATIMLRLEPLLEIINPDFVLVYGDTNTTLAAALTAKKLGMLVCHVEAGCRSFEKYMPEEINRVVTDHLSELHFCPTETTWKNLVNEGIRTMYRTGDVMVDVIRKTNIPKIKRKEKYVLATIHRAENADSLANLSEIIEGLGESEFPVVFPMHPRTRKMTSLFKIHNGENIEIVSPLGYSDMISHIKHAEFVVTDSGGVQKESFLLYVPCLTIRKVTEWPETLTCGWNTLCSPKELKNKITEIQKPQLKTVDMFGDGNAAQKIVKVLEGGC